MDEPRFLALALKNPVNVAILDELDRLALPDAWLVSGCLVQTVWNVLTGRAIDHGIADYDIFYFDPDTSWDAEDAVIRKLQAQLDHLGVKIETRNQARVHLWYPAKHALPYPPLSCSTDGIGRFLTQNTQVGVKPAGDGYEVYAPHGLGDVADLIARPNPGPNFSAANYAAKVARWKALWPELTVIAAE
ncbi:nucleotidyltransferase family protein [Bradyrhizobium sp. WYCCWR 13023]|uniref:Nucleotidyltransferase family protein n=1 Tax=Bradyrhizobium zhengyangense TaxID=2911009 RepID=A0A9X1UG21_9BRAD|nr:nucleotidyltransferase family protein [Bradyrhizobium zhengyangense]MCG2627077.1 nucleotidyltransferase family protein [Bradyrhizobium zhengyangense]MCG2642264.1 nucleotidyltransferase family protein [Bradyrhizobium zhengyangense]